MRTQNQLASKSFLKIIREFSLRVVVKGGRKPNGATLGQIKDRIFVVLKKLGKTRVNEREKQVSEEMSAPRDSIGSTDQCRLTSEEQQRIILEVASHALESGNRDPEQVFAVAAKVSLKAAFVNNLRAYASRAFYRVKSKPRIREEQLATGAYGSLLVDASHVERIEAQILVRELLDSLAAADREIFIRLMDGQTCPEIDVSMGLNPRTAEIRVAVCKNALRKTVQKKLKT